MRTEPVDTFTVGRYTVEIIPDHDPESPAAWEDKDGVFPVADNRYFAPENPINVKPRDVGPGIYTVERRPRYEARPSTHVGSPFWYVYDAATGEEWEEDEDTIRQAGLDYDADGYGCRPTYRSHVASILTERDPSPAWIVVDPDGADVPTDGDDHAASYDPTEEADARATAESATGYHADYWIFPLFAYIHGGVALSLGAFGCPWDSGQIGYMFVKRDEQWSTEEDARKAAESAVEAWNQYLSGDVYGYRVLDEDGDEVDDGSCWGFYGQDNAESEARSAAQYHEDNAVKADNGRALFDPILFGA